jgi:hypothetical protein
MFDTMDTVHSASTTHLDGAVEFTAAAQVYVAALVRGGIAATIVAAGAASGVIQRGGEQ